MKHVGNYYRSQIQQMAPFPSFPRWYTRHTPPFRDHYTAMAWDVRVTFELPIEGEILLWQRGEFAAMMEVPYRGARSRRRWQKEQEGESEW